MNNPDQPVLVRQMTAFFLSVAAIVEGIIRAGNIDRAAMLSFVQTAIDGLPEDERSQFLGTLLAYWHKLIERGPGKTPPPAFH
jgi:hypothetical protein